ncbi:coumaroyl-CoA:anthocyanidin 3-O-glucoside-6''-O-coumaroyltransferase 1-like [Senna tora]|uniref:Coumaroyl-CoA:anthocyanidin 3-O-glucoside-6''-O-coumaroyltransferase 1-like n=1 Tax=Senna tora TaxID=362788 RepID=A0A834TLI2_9FABA|nr:coumaroyl-CoA:anthocyanidin 3-O-glucoside-6''-O-coumaroyltransferase 1-like [Senna tora]
MAHHHLHHNQKISILEQYQVSAPPGSVPSTSLPLTFYDIPWFYSHHIQRIFFYHFPHPTHHFLHTLLPTLKHSLSLTLQHFFPFAANLVFPPQPHLHHPYILYNESDSIPLTVAESTADFNLLVSHSPKPVSDLHPLVPALPPPRASQNGTRFVPLMAVQLTVLPNSGFCICLAFNHVAGDGAAFHHFMKYWASVCRARGDLNSLEPSLPLPCHSREIIDDPKGIKLIYLEELSDTASKSMEFAGLVHDDVSIDKVRATFVMSRDQIEKLKKLVSNSIRCTSSGNLHISAFVVTCSLMWVCMVKLKSEETQGGNNNVPCKLVILADCRNLSSVSIPSTYFGNCLVTRFVTLERGQLVGENGLFEAVKAIERQVRDVKSDALRGVETLMSDYREVSKSGEPLLTIAGSPKLGVYETDFGDEDGGIEVGVALTRTQMNDFTAIFKEQVGHIE